MVSKPNPLLLALALAAALLPAAAAPVAVPTIVVGNAASATGFTLEGTLQAQQQASVAALASGRVLQLAVKAGDRVKAGQVLARIDDRELQAGVAAGEAGVAQAQAALLQAEQNAGRTRELRTQGFVSAAALDSAQAQLQAARAAVQQAQAGRAQAGAARGHATVTAPFDGVVLATHVEAGDLATPGRPLLTVYAPGRLRAVVQLPASRSALARAATQVELTLPDGTKLTPERRTELPALDAVSQTVEWRLDIATAAGAGLQPGLPVQVRFAGAPVAASATGAPLVPTSALLQRGELTAVYAAQGDRFVLKAVRTGARQGDSVPVLAGLKTGERIATDPVRAGLAGATPATLTMAAMNEHATPAPKLGFSGRMAAAFQANAITPLLALVALLLGLFAVLVTPREEEPQINVTMANVLIPFPGASSADVQSKVARPAEQVLGQIAGIEHTYSVSRPGMAVLTVQFKVGVPRTEALVRLYDVLNANQDWLPRELGTLPPIVKPKGIDDVPVLAITLWSRDATSAVELERVAHTVEAELKRVPGAREVATIGGPGRVVEVTLQPQRLRERGVDLLRLQQTLAAASQGMPAGRVMDEGAPRTLAVETGEFLRSADEVGELVVGVNAGKPVYLREVAQLRDGAAQPTRQVWFTPGAATAGVAASAAESGGHPAVTITVTKKPGENAVDVASAARQRLAALQNTVIPEGIEATVVRDYGATAAEKANKLIQKLAFATASVILLVGLALGRREAVIVGAAVILTLTATLFASWAWGFTLNRVSLFALIFSIGILVDDAIVVVENIHRHMALEPGKPLAQIIPAAVDEVGGPTILATLTVIAALLPMAFVSGLIGPYMSPIPINSSLGMALSLAIAFTVTPWLALKLMKQHPAGAHGEHAEPAAPQGLAGKLQRVFASLLTPLLNSARKRWLLLGGIVGALVLSVGLAAVQWVVLKMLPFDNKSEFALVVDMPAGTPVEDTAAALHALGAHLAQQPEVLHLQGYAGTASPITFNGLVRQYYLRADAEQGELQVNLVDKAHRSEQSHAIAQRLRPALEKIAAAHGARLKVVEVPPGPPVMSPLVAEIYGPDEAGRQQLAARVAGAFAATPDITAIDTSLQADAPRAFLRVQRQRAASLGVPVASIAATVHGALSGVDAAYLHDGTAKYPVPVRLQLPRDAQVGLDALLALPMRTASGSLVPLSELVRVERGVIDKPLFTKDLMGVSYVFADVGAGGQTADSPLYGLFNIRPRLQAAALPGTGELGEYWIRQPADAFGQYALKWDGESQITYETFRDMGAAYGVGLILIYLLVVVQFKSYDTPLAIMAPIPLTIIGVMPGHALLQANFTATSMIGMIALAGIIVRNSILLVDFIDLQVARGIAFKEAVVQAAAVRAQPIALTGLAAMTGAVFILDDPIFNGLAISLLFGIFVSTLLTLVVIPVLYYAVNRHRIETLQGATP